MDPNLLAVIVAGALSLAATAMAIVARRSKTKLTAQLEQEGAVEKARRDYEYDALRRLYEEFEPLRFQLLESARNATEFIEHLAHLAKALEPPGSLPVGYYLQLATIYHLLLPSVIFRIFRRRLTLVDLQFSTDIRLSYQIARQIYMSFTQDADMAMLSKISYTPYVDDWREKRAQNPKQFRRQGFALGRLDNALDALVTMMGDAHERPLTFGEFEQVVADVRPDDYRGELGAARDLFLDFTIASRPVLWRLIVAQYFLYDLLAFVHETSDLALADILARVVGTSETKSSILNAASEDEYMVPTEAVRLYLDQHFFPEVERVIGSSEPRA